GSGGPRREYDADNIQGSFAAGSAAPMVGHRRSGAVGGGGGARSHPVMAVVAMPHALEVTAHLCMHALKVPVELGSLAGAELPVKRAYGSREIPGMISTGARPIGHGLEPLRRGHRLRRRATHPLVRRVHRLHRLDVAVPGTFLRRGDLEIAPQLRQP